MALRQRVTSIATRTAAQKIPFAFVKPRFTSRVLNYSPAASRLANQAIGIQSRSKPHTSLFSGQPNVSLLQKSYFSTLPKKAGPPKTGELIETEDFVRKLDVEIDGIVLDEDFIETFLKEGKWKIENRENKAYLSHKVGNYLVTVEFDLPTDEDALLDEYREEEVAEAQDQNGEQPSSNKDLEAFVDISYHNNKGEKLSNFTAQLGIGEDGLLYIEGVRFPEVPKTLWLDTLSDETQTHFYDFFEQLGVDDKMAGFLREYVDQYTLRNDLQNLRLFKQFLQKK